MRNWLIGMHIVEYEQKGEDRARYGAGLLRDLSDKLTGSGLKGFSHTNLKLFRQFYVEYQRLGSVFKMQKPAIGQQVADQLDCRLNEIGQKPSDQSADKSVIPDKASNKFKELQFASDLSPPPEKLIKHFSFSHFVELMRIEDPLKRAFFEVEGTNGCWSVPQLKRQIESLLYERTGLSRNKTGVVEAAHSRKSLAHIEDMLRDPYVLEFTGLPERHEYSETDLETALLDHIQSFLLELGNGFCFEARQKRITLDNEHDRIAWMRKR
jgi:predicted nuclease of restriction endonuclease-like (RecB) superfamily